MSIVKDCKACGRCVVINGKFSASVLCALCDPDNHKRESRTWTKGIRRTLFARHAGTCHWCSLKVVRDHATVDHLVPLSRGGTNEIGNLVLACRPCNLKRGNETPRETKRRLQLAAMRNRKEIP